VHFYDIITAENVGAGIPLNIAISRKKSNQSSSNKVSNKSNLIDITLKFGTRKFSIIRNNLISVASTKSGAGTKKSEFQFHCRNKY
jgi:hypothetical protein